MSNEKGRSPKIDLPLLKNDITRFFIDIIRVFNSRNMQR